MNGSQSFNDIANPTIYHLVEQIKQTSIFGNLSICSNELLKLFKELHNTISLFFDEMRYCF